MFREYEEFVEEALKRTMMGDVEEDEWDIMMVSDSEIETIPQTVNVFTDEFKKSNDVSHDVTMFLFDFQWFELLDYSLNYLIKTSISRYISLLKDKLDKPYLTKLENYLKHTLIHWLKYLSPSCNYELKVPSQVLSAMHVEFVKLRTSEIFSLF